MAASDDKTGRKDGPDGHGDAGHDASIAERLEKNPSNVDAQLDRGLDESMDASDPPAATRPGDTGDAPKSSGYDEEHEAKLRDGE